ncbi:hypothetical protein ABID62_002781 [Bradyrhizobium sp. S3.9.1]
MWKPLASLILKPCLSSSIAHGAGKRRRLSIHPRSPRHEATLRDMAARRSRQTAGDKNASDYDGGGVAELGPLLDQIAHDRPHPNDFLGDKGAVIIPIDLLMHDGFGLAHADAQRPRQFSPRLRHRANLIPRSTVAWSRCRGVHGERCGGVQPIAGSNQAEQSSPQTSAFFGGRFFRKEYHRRSALAASAYPCLSRPALSTSPNPRP